MRKVLPIIFLLFSFFSLAQTDSIPTPDINASQRLLDNFIKYNPDYVTQKDEAVTRIKQLAKKVFDLEKAVTWFFRFFFKD